MPDRTCCLLKDQCYDWCCQYTGCPASGGIGGGGIGDIQRQDGIVVFDVNYLVIILAIILVISCLINICCVYKCGSQQSEQNKRLKLVNIDSEEEDEIEALKN